MNERSGRRVAEYPSLSPSLGTRTTFPEACGTLGTRTVIHEVCGELTASESHCIKAMTPELLHMSQFRKTRCNPQAVTDEALGRAAPERTGEGGERGPRACSSEI